MSCFELEHPTEQSEHFRVFKYTHRGCLADTHQATFHNRSLSWWRPNEVAYWQEVLQHTAFVTLRILLGNPFVMGRGADLLRAYFSAFFTFTKRWLPLFDPCGRAAGPWNALCQLSLEWPLIITELEALMSSWWVWVNACAPTLQHPVNTLWHIVAIPIRAVYTFAFHRARLCGK